MVKDSVWDDTISEWRTTYITSDLLRIRRNAEGGARDLLESKLGHFSTEELIRFLRLLNTDWVHESNTEGCTRFGLSFIGANRNKIVEHLDAFNEWSALLWTALEPAYERSLDRFWRRRSLPGAGTGLPTALLYLRNPTRFNIWVPFTTRGLAHLTGIDVGPSRTGATYRHYNDAVNQSVRSVYDLQPQEVDFILFKAEKST